MKLAYVLIPSKSAPGKFNALDPIGSVYSVQPTGAIELRPHGTDGPYEQCERVGALLHYVPDTGIDVFVQPE